MGSTPTRSTKPRRNFLRGFCVGESNANCCQAQGHYTCALAHRYPTDTPGLSIQGNASFSCTCTPYVHLEWIYMHFYTSNHKSDPMGITYIGSIRVCEVKNLLVFSNNWYFDTSGFYIVPLGSSPMQPPLLKKRPA